MGNVKIYKRQNYMEYIKLLAESRLVYQLDMSFVPGQVAGDCLLARVPCLGGNGAIERIAFENLQFNNEKAEKSHPLLQKLLYDDEFYQQNILEAQKIAQKELSFKFARQKIKTIAQQML